MPSNIIWIFVAFWPNKKAKAFHLFKKLFKVLHSCSFNKESVATLVLAKGVQLTFQIYVCIGNEK